MPSTNPRHCRSCSSPARIPCYWAKHIDCCKACGSCYAPPVHGPCPLCAGDEDYVLNWDHEFWANWWKECTGGVGEIVQQRVAAEVQARADELEAVLGNFVIRDEGKGNDRL
ncbi:hypothetical protein BDW62DRAFT_204052 [Aspergillus aurantiobrunneus]